MRDRLIELIEEAHRSWLEYVDECAFNQTALSFAFEQMLADHLLAEGVIVLPCKLNSTVYDISEFIDDCPCPDMYEFSTEDILLSRCRTTKEMIFGIDGINYAFDEFGTRVFKTEAEAYKKISELERSENGKH